MMLLRVLTGCRPFWQVAILLFYSFYVTDFWQKALIAAVGAVFIASNLALGWNVSHPSWHKVERGVLLVEAAVACVSSIVLSNAWPIGPACLLLLPSLVSYAWMFERGIWAYSMAALPWVLLLTVSLPAVRVGAASLLHSQAAAVFPGLILALYAALSGFGAFLAFLLQRQRREGRDLEDMIRTTEGQSVELGRLNAQITDYANQVYDLAKAEERNRIAGEIHDTVAHRLTALIVQLQASKRFIQDRAAVEDASGNIEVCEALAREALDEVRRSVRSIRRPSDVEGLDVLRRLAKNYGALTGMDVSLDVPPDIPPLSARHISVLYRVLEESLTNAQRHGKATRVQLTMVHSGGMLGVQIDDNGRGTTQLQYGFGLSSMRDRLRGLGAEMQVESAPGSGFSIRLKMPVWEGSVE